VLVLAAACFAAGIIFNIVGAVRRQRSVCAPASGIRMFRCFEAVLGLLLPIFMWSSLSLAIDLNQTRSEHWKLVVPSVIYMLLSLDHKYLVLTALGKSIDKPTIARESSNTRRTARWRR
jgi:hypothetical protein